MTEFIAEYWLQTIFGLIVVGLGTAIKIMSSQFKALKLGMQALLRNQIIEQYNKYTAMKRIPIYGLENVTAMYEQYHALGGNGAITHLYEEVKELPVGGRNEVQKA
jgi:hypothetical protein